MTAKREMPFVADVVEKSAQVQHYTHANHSFFLETCTKVATKIKMLRSGKQEHVIASSNEW